MLKNFFEKIYIIGNGITALKCGEILVENSMNFKYLNTKKNKYPFSLKRLYSKNIKIEDFSKSVQDKIASASCPVLILSINNTFIFAAEFLENKNITIINYHNSLLPVHRGMNAEAWAIFERNSQTGVTWHVVDDGIDTGPIICQRAIPIHDEMTSIALLQIQSYAATELLKQNIASILANDYKTISNSGRGNKSIHYKNQIPGDSFLDCTWPHEKIWSFLRAMDYGPYYNLGIPKVRLGPDIFSWRHYSRKCGLTEYRHIRQGQSREQFLSEEKTVTPELIDNVIEKSKNQNILKEGNDIIVNDCFYLHEIFKIQDRLI